MQSFKNTKKMQETETIIKESLLQQLSYSVKEIQLVVSKKNEVFSTNEECNSLIVVLEAIFLHGLKTGLLKTALKTMAVNTESKPQPSFWNTVCNYTHKNTLSCIRKLPQIKTDVGRCRVWIRMALNECELTSYFAIIEKDRRALNNSHSNYAFLRDRETCDTACKLLQGLLNVKFEIPVNSSILNVWNLEPLMLSGIWLPPIKTPLSTGVDIAEKIGNDDGDEEDDSCSIKTSSSITTLSSLLALDETQALKIILETPIKKLNRDINLSFPFQYVSKLECESSILEEEEAENRKNSNATVNIIAEKNLESVSHSFSLTDKVPETNFFEFETTSTPQMQKKQEKELKAEDYSTILENLGISPNQKVNYENRLKEVMQKQNEGVPKSSLISSNELSNYCNSFTSKLYKIVRETGLKVQKYTCASCQVSVGVTFGEARLCHFTGEYYCNRCHLNDISPIPSRIILNWDHTKYPVSKNAFKYLTDICNRLLIDVKKLNPKLYSVVQEMKELREIRVQLNMLRAYFYTCRESVLLDLQKKVTPREYLYEFIDHYSFNDLAQVPGGVLASELNALISFGKNHVINCWLCSQKGFICEICKNSKIIYPFERETTYRCSKCFNIYHKSCLSSHKNCPKCKRLKSRTLFQSENLTVIQK